MGPIPSSRSHVARECCSVRCCVLCCVGYSGCVAVCVAAYVAACESDMLALHYRLALNSLGSVAVCVAVCVAVGVLQYVLQHLSQTYGPYTIVSLFRR